MVNPDPAEADKRWQESKGGGMEDRQEEEMAERRPQPEEWIG